MTHANLFSGIGMWEYAAEKLGMQNIFSVEWDKFCQQVLKKNFNHEIYGDVKEFDGTKYAGTIDILSGSPPCQAFSQAGKRRGRDDDRHLWPEYLRIISQIKPRWICFENVYGYVTIEDGLAFEQTFIDLGLQGYEAQAFIIPALAVDACHRRDRLWIIGRRNTDTDSIRPTYSESEIDSAKGRLNALCNVTTVYKQDGGYNSDTPIIRHSERESNNNRPREDEQTNGHNSFENPILNGCLCGESGEEGTEIREQRDFSAGNGIGIIQPSKCRRHTMGSKNQRRDSKFAESFTNTEIKGREKLINGDNSENRTENETGMDDRFERYDRTTAYSERIRQSGQRFDRGQLRTEPDREGQTNRVVHDYQQQETWYEAATRLCRVANDDSRRLHRTYGGYSESRHRKERIKALGNTIIWPIAYRIFASILETEKLIH